MLRIQSATSTCFRDYFSSSRHQPQLKDAEHWRKGRMASAIFIIALFSTCDGDVMELWHTMKSRNDHPLYNKKKQSWRFLLHNPQRCGNKQLPITSYIQTTWYLGPMTFTSRWGRISRRGISWHELVDTGHTHWVWCIHLHFPLRP